MSFKPLKKIVSIFILITFIVGTGQCPVPTYAAPESKSIFKNKKIDYQKISDKNDGIVQNKKAVLSGEDSGQAASQKKEAQRILSSHLSDISLIHLPAELGRIVEAYQAPSDESRATND